MEKDRKLLIFCPSARGGIADYAHEQARAVGVLGIEVTMLCPGDFCHPADGYVQVRHLTETPPKRGSRVTSRLRFVRRILHDHRVLDQALSGGGVKRVLFATYAEYLAPLWAWRLRRHQRRGVIFGAIAHDPVRDYQVGPRWWHRWSIAEGYSFVREAFVHEAITLDTIRPFPFLRTTVIPHGIFAFPSPTSNRSETRKSLGIPETVSLFLSFGHIRDNKNLPLVLQALSETPTVWLLVAGPEAKSGQTSSSDLKELAGTLGIADRCRWLVDYLEPIEVANCFNACDAALLTYASTFRSASGVQNVAGWFRKPVLVSGGDGNLKSSVEKYRLGLLVAPDSAESIASGIDELLRTPFVPDWDAYLAENSWERNGCIVVESIFE
jgi:glycosyltransferase involved in cell wall biosynthesis